MCSTRWKREQMKQCPVFSQMRQRTPKVHCLTNPVTMQDVANVLLAAGGSAVMAQDAAEVEEITALCDATLLNTGVPSLEKFHACTLAGVRANGLASGGAGSGGGWRQCLSAQSVGCAVRAGAAGHHPVQSRGSRRPVGAAAKE